MKINKITLLTSVVSLCCSCSNIDRGSLEAQYLGDTHTNYSLSPATRWQDALVSGNGEMGIMVFGNPRTEKVVFNHESLYEFLGTESVEAPYIANVMPKVKELIKEGHYKKAKQLTLDEAVKKGHTEILWTDPYHPACALNILQDFTGDISNYSRATEYNSGKIRVDWRADDINYTRDFFVSRTEDVIIGNIEASKNGAINLSISLSHQMDVEAIKANDRTPAICSNIKKVNPDNWKELTMPYVNAEEYQAEDSWLTFRVSYQVYDRGYEVITYVRNRGGNIHTSDNAIIVKDADKVEVISKVVPIEPYSSSKINELKAEMQNLASYDKLLNNHTKEHSQITNRIVLNLDKSGFSDGPNEELIATQKDMDKINPYLLEKLFNMGLYTLASSSGNNPPNLMGIWNGEWRPNWSGDFTLDANINLQISAANLANMPEAIDSYMKLLERLAPDWEVNAKKLYGCRGYNAGTRTSGRRGFATHFFNFPGHYWTAGAEWLLYPCYEYYLCSGDKEFLHNRLFPMMEKVALFYEDFLDTYDYNDKYLFAPSYSPENAAVLSNGEREAAVANATMDLATAKEALNNIITVCEQEGINHEKLPLWREMLTKIPPYMINSDGALQEWSRKDLKDFYNHRHISHLYPVWPGLEISREDSVLFNAACVAIDKRGRGNGSAHGLAHTALIAARLKKADLVYGNIRYILTNNYLYNSLFTSHNPGIIYNSDALHSLPAVVLEMLVYSRPGVIELIPALSEQLSKGSISGVMCRTQAKVENMEWDMTNQEVSAKISSSKDQEIKIQLNKDITKIKVDGESFDASKDYVLLHFNTGQTREIKFFWK